jgi:hypothetical protein
MIPLDDESIFLLLKVAEQQTPAFYGPDKTTDLAAFQRQADRLLFLREQGLIELLLEPSRETSSGHNYIDSVAVRRILPRGRRILIEEGLIDEAAVS